MSGSAARASASAVARAERVRAGIDELGESFESGMRAYLFNVLGLEVRLASLAHGIARRREPDGRTLSISDLLPFETAQFLLAHHLGELRDTEPG